MIYLGAVCGSLLTPSTHAAEDEKKARLPEATWTSLAAAGGLGLVFYFFYMKSKLWLGLLLTATPAKFVLNVVVSFISGVLVTRVFPELFNMITAGNKGKLKVEPQSKVQVV
jgi:hypothetical protein